MAERTVAIDSHPDGLMFDLSMVFSLPEECSGRRSTEPVGNTTLEFPTVSSTQACPVCLDHFQDEGGKQTPCGHVYHSACIVRWLSQDSSCPMCRRLISGAQ